MLLMNGAVDPKPFGLYFGAFSVSASPASVSAGVVLAESSRS